LERRWREAFFLYSFRFQSAKAGDILLELCIAKCGVLLFFLSEIVMAEEQSYRKKMETQLNELGAQIQDLLNKVGAGVDKEVEALRPKLKAAAEKLDELKQTSTEAWGDLKPGLEKAWSELQKSVGEAAARFKTPRSKL